MKYIDIKELIDSFFKKYNEEYSSLHSLYTSKTEFLKETYKVYRLCFLMNNNTKYFIKDFDKCFNTTLLTIKD